MPSGNLSALIAEVAREEAQKEIQFLRERVAALEQQLESTRRLLLRTTSKLMRVRRALYEPLD